MITDITERVWCLLQSGRLLDILSQTGSGPNEATQNNYGVGTIERAMDELGDVKTVVEDNDKGCNPWVADAYK